MRSILLTWGLAVLMLAGLFSYALWNQQREQNRAMCEMLSLFTGGPEPVAGPAGDRGRVVLAGMRKYARTIDCDI